MDGTKYRVYICSGPNCGPKGSPALLGALMEELVRLGLASEVSVAATGCQNHCETGPTMVVYPGPVFYQEVDSARLRRIATEHLQQGKPVTEYFWAGPRPAKSQILKSFPAEISGEAFRTPSRDSGRPQQKKLKRSYEDVDDFKW